MDNTTTDNSTTSSSVTPASNTATSDTLEHSEQPHWYAMRVVGHNVDIRIRSELDEAGIRYFQPMHEVLRTYHGKQKVQMVPVVGGLFFTYGCESDILVHTQRSLGRFQFIIPRGHRITDRIIINDKEMDDFIRVVESKYPHSIMSVDEVRKSVGKKVRILEGPLKGVVGKLVSPPRGKQKLLIVQVEGLMAASVPVKLTPEYIEVLK